jgi:hypothetical protein
MTAPEPPRSRSDRAEELKRSLDLDARSKKRSR